MSNTVKRLQKEIPGIRIAVIAHGDYWDTHTYVTKIMDFSTDGKKLCDFIQNVEGTGVWVGVCVCGGGGGGGGGGVFCMCVCIYVCVGGGGGIQTGVCVFIRISICECIK